MTEVGDVMAGETGFAPWPVEVASGYRSSGYWRGRTLAQLSRDWCAAWAERPALVDGRPVGCGEVGRVWTYAELDARADAIAGVLWRTGVRTGDRVVVHLPNSLEFVAVLFALFRIAALPVLALPAHRSSEIRHLVRATAATAYVIPTDGPGTEHTAIAHEAAAESPSLRHVFVAGAAREFVSLAGPARTEVPWPNAAPSEVAFFLLSGGSTGAPKLIPRTHDDYACNIRLSAVRAELSASTIYLTTVPLAHNYGLGCPGVLGTLSVGGTAVCTDDGTPARAFALIEHHRATHAALVPPLAMSWLDAAPASRRDLTSLRLVQVGGQRFDSAAAARVPDVLGCRLQQSFGMAEGILCQTSWDDPAELVRTTQGRPLAEHDEILVVDESGRPVPPGESGQLLVRGPYTIRGYYREDDYNRTAFTPDGYLRTGDVVHLLRTGHLVVDGRLTDVINRGGNKVSPGELEDHLRAHPEVVDVVVVSIPDSFLGEQTCAVLRDHPAGNPDLASLKRFLSDRGVARYKWPDILHVVDSFPRTAAGKVSRAELRATLS